MAGSELSYYEINKLLWRWSKKEGARIVHEASLSMDKAPPALPRMPEPKAPPAPKPDPAAKMASDIIKVADTFSRFKKWLDTPDPPKAPPAKKDYMAVPLFDIQQIPGAMRKEFQPHAAKLMERWFAGELNYGPTEKDVAAEINQKGEPYPPSMYDTTTVKLDWVLKYEEARLGYDYLINEKIRNPAARDTLRKMLKKYRAHANINTWEACGGKLSSLHRHFQFQLVGVGSTFFQKASEYVSAYKNNGVPTDLNGALGSFNIYAAIGYAHSISGGIMEVSGVYVYIKDSFDFTDEPGKPSQYLGHWSKDGVIVVPYNGAAAALGVSSLYTSYPVRTPNGSVYYPVHDSDFRKWALKHQRGGDFYVYSDYRFVPCDPPIRVYLDD
ncbi:DUF6402 family protein [Paraburkholderia lycopersici]|uniref:Uncharacterized protein n=1 Tax=Paraburkholderia lycopersici TaxID=416944 RepID=A0A1G7A798_9BURK|nr:DUF6402 family protein [Paraburkholderia lycopersici]SDE10670.1 hypothetical protein SAMN05421548_1339 [Paraburkholderia lycopersici]